MNFAGILSRKAGRTVSMNANASQVSNPEVEVAVAEPDAHQAMVEAMGSRLVIGSVPREPKPAARKAKAELKQQAEDVAPMAAPAQPAPARTEPKAEATPKPKRIPKSKAETKAKAEPKAEAPAPQAEEKPRLTIMEYSAKCLALFGDTKPIKDRLKKLGGRYNPHLHPFGQDTSVPGWVFPLRCRAELEKMIG